MTDYLISIDCQIAQIVEKYQKKAPLQFEDQSQLKRPQISEYNPMITPLKIDKAFPSFQNSHRMDQNQSHQQIEQSQLNQSQLGKQTEMKQSLKESLLQKDDLISQSPLLKNDLDEDLRELIQNDNNNQDLFNTNHQILKMKDLDETLLQEQDNQSFYQEQMLRFGNEIIQKYSHSDKDECSIDKQDALQQQEIGKIQPKKLNEIEVSTKPREIKASQNMKIQQQTEIKGIQEKSKVPNNRQQSKEQAIKSQRGSSKSQTRNQLTSKAVQQTAFQSQKPASKDKTKEEAIKSKTQQNSKPEDKQQDQRQNLVKSINPTNQRDKSKDPNQNKKPTQPQRSQSQNKSQVRNVSVPKLKLNQIQSQNSETQKETLFGFNIINKNLVEVQNSNFNSCLSGLLSPINLKNSDRDMTSKLDQLYQSYENKEKFFGLQANKNSSLLNQVFVFSQQQRKPEQNEFQVLRLKTARETKNTVPA
eukprot:403375007